jgi:hypothetical protein
LWRRTGQSAPQHYAFLVSDDDFDAIYGKISSRGLQHWADPAGHYLEILTRPYGSGG